MTLSLPSDPSTASETGEDALDLALFQRVRQADPFRPRASHEVTSAYVRPTALGEFSLAELTRPVDRRALSTQRSLVLHQLLWNGYEQGNLYLPSGVIDDAKRGAFDRYYEPGLVAASAALRPTLERAGFAFLRDIDVEGATLTVEGVREKTTAYLRAFEAETSEVVTAIRASKNPRAAARLWLLQVAPDFLSEASQMARALPGSFGPVHSELTKIFIDEFGYGVHDSKHSTLFERTLESVGLSSAPHAYYHWYLPTSLAMTSYFYAVTMDKRRFFEYLGALWWIEAVVPHFNRQFRTLLKSEFGEQTDTEYFDEHIGIDIHHRRMALEKLIVPCIAEHGPSIVPSVLRGIEAARLLGTVADEDFLAQIRFLDDVASDAGLPAATRSGALRASFTASGEDWLIAPRIADEDSVLVVVEGAVTVEGGYLTPVRFTAGQSLQIPAGRLYSVKADGAARVDVRAPEAPC